MTSNPPLRRVPIALPAVEQRKLLIEGIRSRTTSRASQMGPPMIAELLSSADTQANPAAATNVEVKFSSKVDDESWMLPDPSDKGKPTSKQQKKKKQGVQLKTKAIPSSLSKSDDVEPEETPDNTEVKSLTELFPELPTEEEGDEIQDSTWATVVKSKPKRKEQDSGEKSTPKKREEGDLPEKSNKRLSDAQAWIKHSESSKKSKAKLVEEATTTESEYCLKHEEFPDLGSHNLTPRKKLGNSSPTKTPSQSAQTTKTKATYDIIPKSASQKEIKQKTKVARNMSEGKPDGSVMETAKPTAKGDQKAAKDTRISTSALENAAPLDKRSVSASYGVSSNLKEVPAPLDKRSVSASYGLSSNHKEVPATARSVIDSRPTTPRVFKSVSSADVPNVGMTDASEFVHSQPSPCSSAPTKAELISDHDSQASEKTVVPENHEDLSSDPKHDADQTEEEDLPLAAKSTNKTFDYQDDAHSNFNISEFIPVYEQSFAKNGNQDHFGHKERKLTFTSDEGTVYGSMMGYKSAVPHPLVEGTAKINREFVSSPGKITVNGTDAVHVLRDKFPRPLTFQDHPDINVFLNSDWIACAYCDKLIREANGDGTIVCGRCGPCSLTRYCNLACLLNHLKEHWEKCGGASSGRFPLDWTKLPSHYFTLLPALGTWSDEYLFARTFERRRQMTYIANLHDEPVKNIRGSHFRKLLTAGGTSPAVQEVRQYMTTDRSWNAPQPKGDYFLFINYEHIDKQCQLEQDGTPMGIYEYLASSILQRHRHTEGLCQSMAIPIQFEERHRVPFNRLINACLVSNDANLVEYLWRWIRSEISGNQELLRYCQNFGLDQAALFTLWTHQFEQEFGVTESAQSAMLDRIIQSLELFIPFSDMECMPLHQQQAHILIVELIYKYELSHPLLRAWRRRGPNEHYIPEDPWGRFRGDGWHPYGRSGGQVTHLHNPSELVWNNGWHGMPPETWQNWLNDKHVANIQLALEYEKKLLDNMQSSKSKLEPFNFSRFGEWYANARTGVNEGYKWVVMRDGVELEPSHQLESRLKTLSPEVTPEIPPIGLGGRIYVRDNNFVVPASLASPPKANSATTNSFTQKSQLNPTVPAFRSTSPPKNTTQTNIHADMPPKPLATSADAKGWLNYSRDPLVFLDRANIPATRHSIVSSTHASTTDDKLLTDDVYYGRWVDVKAAWVNHVKQENAKKVARDAEIMQLTMEYDAALKRVKAKQMEDFQTSQANVTLALAKMEEIEDEILGRGRHELWHRIQDEKVQEDKMLRGIEDSGDIDMGGILDNGSSVLVPSTHTTITAEAQGATALVPTGVATVAPPPPPIKNWASIVGSKAKDDTSSVPPPSGLAVFKKPGAVQALTKSAATLFKPSSNKAGASSIAISNGSAPFASTNGKEKEQQKPNGKDQQKPNGSGKDQQKPNANGAGRRNKKN